MAIIVVSLIVVIFLVLCFFVSIQYPECTFALFVVSWKFRKLWKIRGDYVWSLGKNPPDSYEFFQRRAKQSLYPHWKVNDEYAEEIMEWLNYPSFIHYYFTQDRFTASLYYKMVQDYRSGEYKKEYDPIRVLKGVLPVEISSSEGAFTDFMKFVDKGWFDRETGMYVLADGRKKQDIGRAIFWICRRNSIPAPERVFAPLWKMDPKTVKEWLRGNINTTRIDNIVEEILKQ